MSGNRSISALTDEEHRLVEAAEQDLSRLLSVEPSPAFAAKIRARLREEERPGQWRGRWAPMALAASVVLIAGIALLMSRMAGEPEMEHGAGAATARHDVSLPADPHRADPAAVRADPAPQTLHPRTRRADPVLRSASAGWAAHTSTIARDRQRSTEPPVLIDPQRGDAVNRLLAMLRSGTADLPATPPDVQDLTVPPVVVDQLDVPLLSVNGDSDETNALRR
jgi:hypothetical protein